MKSAAQSQRAAGLHHGFSKHSSRALYNSLYYVTGSLVVHAFQVIMGNINWLEDAQTDELRIRLRLRDPI